MLPLPEKAGKVCQNENRAIKLQLDEKISEIGLKTIKIGFPSANMCIQACICVRRDAMHICKMDHASM